LLIGVQNRSVIQYCIKIAIQCTMRPAQKAQRKEFMPTTVWSTCYVAYFDVDVE